MEDLHRKFGDVEPFLRNDLSNKDVACKTTLEMCLGPTRAELEVEMAVLMDVAQVLVQQTYRLEGCGEEIFEAYDGLQACFKTLHEPVHTHPNVNAALVKWGANDGRRWGQLLRHADAVVQPAKDYFDSKFGEIGAKYSDQVALFKAIRFCDPKIMRVRQPTTQDYEGATLYLDLEKRYQTLL